MWKQNSEILQNNLKKTPKKTPKWRQNGAKSGTKTTLETLQTQKMKLNLNSVILGRPGAPKRSPKTPQKQEKLLWNLISWSLKNDAFPEAFFLLFLPFWEIPDPGNQAKTLYCRSKSRFQIFTEKTQTFQNTTENASPNDPPKRGEIGKDTKKRTLNKH